LFELAKDELRTAAQLIGEIVEHQQAKNKLRRLTANYKERNKELNCFYELSKLVEESDNSLDKILQGVVDFMPAAYQYPEIAAARIKYKSKQYKTDNFRKTKWCQSSPIKVERESVGILEVCYRKRRPAADDGPFLYQEELLINSIAERVGSIIERINNTKGLEDSHRQLRNINQELRASEEKYRRLFQNSRDALVVLSPEDYRFHDANEAALKLFGCNLKGLTGKTVLQLSPKLQPDKIPSAEKARKIVKETLKKGETFFEWEHKRCDNHQNFYTTVSLTKFRFNKKTFLQASIRDITAKKRLEDRLLESEKKYRNLFQKMTSGVAVYEAVNNGRDFVFVDLNKAAEKIDGIKKEEILGRKVTQVFPAVKGFGLFEVFKKVWCTGKTIYHPACKYQDKRIVGWRENWVYKLPSGLIVAIYNDITQRKRAEIELKKSYEKIQELTESVLDILWSYHVDNKGNVIDESITGQVEKILEVREGAIGDSMEKFFSFIHPDDLPAVKQKIQAAAENAPVADAIEYRLCLPDGKIKWVHSQGVSKKNIDGTAKIYGVTSDITQRKRAEIELKKSYEKIQELTESVLDILWSYHVDSKGKLIETSITWQADKILELEPGTIGNDFGKYFSFVHPDDFPAVKQELSRALQQKRAVAGIEYRLVLPSGKIKWVHSRGMAKGFAGGSVKAYGITSDITARKQMEEELRVTSERLDLALRAADIGPWEWNLETNEVYFSPQWKAQIGYEPDELLNLYQEWEDRLHPEDKSRVIAAVRQYIKGERKDYEVDFRFRHKDGTYRWIYTQGQKYSRDNKTLMMLGCHIDITDRKKIENKINHAQRRLRMVLDNIFDSVWTMDLKGNFTFASPSFERITGYTAKEALHLNMKDVLTPESALKAKKTIEYFISATSEKPGLVELEHVAKDGTHKWCEVKASFRYNQQGKPVEIIGVTRDVTMRRRAAQSMRLAQLGKLVADMAHQVNNPLMIISGQAQLMEMEQIENKAVQEGLVTIVDQCRRAKDIIQRLLKFSKPSSSRVEKVDINQLINKAAALVEQNFLVKGVRLVKEFSKVPLININEGQLQEVFMNLFNNAREAMPGGGTIRISTYIKDDNLVIDFIDNGQGMTEKELREVFTPFFTTKEIGTGLGVPVCYGIIKANGGRLEYMSQKGEGTTARIIFPLRKQDKDENYSS
jgi:PAS domain S-box-containing protein